MNFEILFAIFLFSGNLQNVNGQFPASCIRTISRGVCCPNNCNAASGRGTCTTITNQANSQWNNGNSTIRNLLSGATFTKKDSRVKWPTAIFTQVCVCNDPFFGPDCSDCKFGRTGPDCSYNYTVTRPNFRELSSDKQTRVVNAIISAKYSSNKPWAVVLTEPARSSSTKVTMQTVTSYDLFVYLHHMAARENDQCKGRLGTIIDFAHEGPTFLTWHRYYLLLFERELQTITNDSSFALPYWDWETHTGKEIFNDGLFGTLSPAIWQYRVLIGGNIWNTACDVIVRNPRVSCEKSREPCNLQQPTGTLWRIVNDNFSPRLFEIHEALKQSVFENQGDGGWNKKSTGFRNILEGFVGLYCSESTLTTYRDHVGNLNGAHAFLHNKVHIYFGGHLGNAPSASNDPIFFLHHANIDRMFEMWLNKYPLSLRAGYKPVSGAHPGHNRDDWLVPLFPLVTNGEMFDRSTEFGYRYESLELEAYETCGPTVDQESSHDSTAVLQSATGLLILMLLMLLGAFV